MPLTRSFAKGGTDWHGRATLGMGARDQAVIRRAVAGADKSPLIDGAHDPILHVGAWRIGMVREWLRAIGKRPD